MNILVAVDDSEFAASIADFVVAHDWPANAEFTVLTVVQSLSPVTAALPPPVLQELEKDQYMAAREVLDRIAYRISKKGYRVFQRTAEGSPKRQILAVAKEIGAQAIVIGSHGRSGLERLMLGSVSLAVASGAHCSVLIVRPLAEVEHEITATEYREKGLVV